VADIFENAITFVRIDGGDEIVERIPGYWPVPVGGVIELGNPNRDFGVVSVRIRVNSTEIPPRIDLYLDCTPLPLSLRH